MKKEKEKKRIVTAWAKPAIGNGLPFAFPFPNNNAHRAEHRLILSSVGGGNVESSERVSLSGGGDPEVPGKNDGQLSKFKKK